MPEKDELMGYSAEEARRIAGVVVWPAPPPEEIESFGGPFITSVEEIRVLHGDKAAHVYEQARQRYLGQTAIDIEDTGSQ